jgi:hypothetical protein
LLNAIVRSENDPSIVCSEVVVDVELAFVLDFRVVEEESLDPRTRRRRARLGAQLVDDARDRDELDLERIANEHLVHQHRSRRVIVTIGEPWYDGHARPFAEM